MSRVHRYEGADIVVEFDLGRCIHTGDCSRDLPEVFNSKRSGRWVKPDAAHADDVARICANCPTGALRCINKSTTQSMDAAPQHNSVQMMADGPLYVHAAMMVNGKQEPGYRAAFCRCGASRLMPYCDNSHRNINFSDAGKVLVPLPSHTKENGGLTIRAMANGPLKIDGSFTLLDATGDKVCASSGAAMCRCGASNMKPYCDGSHIAIGFQSEGAENSEQRS
ncbi:MAG: CDGSH iron-sulfur domain-containing protein [Mariprofundus sp.]|nr:CDGSH iron-sulfur domain-containing protein [Mariprofundus sp.]